MTRVLHAQIDLLGLENKPEHVQLVRRVLELEADHDAPLGKPLDVDAPADVPHEQAHVQVLARHLLLDPAATPDPHLRDDRPQLLTRFREAVLGVIAVLGGAANHDPGVLQLLQPLGK